MTTVEDIIKEYIRIYRVNYDIDIVYRDTDKAYKNEILLIFDYGFLPKTVTVPVLWYFMGVYHEAMKNTEQAKNYYLIATEAEHEDAIFRLGMLYMGEKQYKLGVKYYHLATKLGHTIAPQLLAKYYMNIDVKHSFAKHYYQIAVDAGNVYAMIELGEYYINCEKNRDMALKYFILAHDNNYISAYDYIGRTYFNYGQSTKAEQYLAVKYFKIGSDKGCNNCTRNLAYYYMYYARDYDIAKKYFIKSIANGYIWEIDAMRNIKILKFTDSELVEIANAIKDYKENKMDALLDYLHPDYKCSIAQLLGKLCLCNKCYDKFMDTVDKSLITHDICHICISPDVTLCIPYSHLCKHSTCVPCHQTLKNMGFSCPYCRK